MGNVEYVEMFTDENGKARGVGIVEFKDPDNVGKALEVMNRYQLQGRELVVKEGEWNYLLLFFFFKLNPNSIWEDTPDNCFFSFMYGFRKVLLKQFNLLFAFSCCSIRIYKSVYH